MARIEGSKYFHPEIITRYCESLNSKQRLTYEASLRYVKRWQDPEIKHVVSTSNLRDNNLIHVLALGQMDFEIEQKYPRLAKEIDFVVVNGMHIVHDGAEWKIGDWPAIGTLRDSVEGQQAKAQESSVVEQMITENVRPDQQGFWWSLYKRYSAKNPEDKESMFANFTDKADAATRSGVHVFNPDIQGDQLTTDLRIRHMLCVRKMMQYVSPLMNLLSEKAQADMQEVVDSELQRLRNIGFGYELDLLLKPISK